MGGLVRVGSVGQWLGVAVGDAYEECKEDEKTELIMVFVVVRGLCWSFLAVGNDTSSNFGMNFVTCAVATSYGCH
jgi:hypothetical protein